MLIGLTVGIPPTYASRYRNTIEAEERNEERNLLWREIRGTNIGYRSAERCSLGVSRTRYLIIPRPLIYLRRHTRHAMQPSVDAATAEPSTRPTRLNLPVNRDSTNASSTFVPRLL